MKKLCSMMMGLAMIGIISFGLNSFVETLQSAHGDYPAPANPDYVNIGEGGGAPSNFYGDYPAPKEI
ncbi:Phr family secreted Rap phosphatase inhibitor [Bacillus pseudomycoides]|uniref:Phr family secreted Rap phosphatase inhibitor n=1 Tax=Bacillus pseudomycoides TaxID=64104 RepID=UPI000BF7F4C4|nr:Phr family secreted Rap phosphatase inhibitor [Bacillus pseudomycoides]PEP54094.1 Phr family secreted Rap phosphatase inhibitor [Bacillus pseudomycoides]PHC81015.1 Phr family secreted Rap phosphatase inhibitor [Bacillus pseudomycoides]